MIGPSHASLMVHLIILKEEASSVRTSCGDRGEKYQQRFWCMLVKHLERKLTDELTLIMLTASSSPSAVLPPIIALVVRTKFLPC